MSVCRNHSFTNSLCSIKHLKIPKNVTFSNDIHVRMSDLFATHEAKQLFLICCLTPSMKANCQYRHDIFQIICNYRLPKVDHDCVVTFCLEFHDFGLNASKNGATINN